MLGAPVGEPEGDDGDPLDVGALGSPVADGVPGPVVAGALLLPPVLVDPDEDAGEDPWPVCEVCDDGAPPEEPVLEVPLAPDVGPAPPVLDLVPPAPSADADPLPAHADNSVRPPAATIIRRVTFAPICPSFPPLGVTSSTNVGRATLLSG